LTSQVSATLAPEKEPPVFIGQKAAWNPRAGLDDVEKRKFLTLRLRRATRHVLTRVAKRIDVDGGIFETVLN
jgi:hypothetical protein